MDITIAFTAIVSALLGALIAKWAMKSSHQRADTSPWDVALEQIIGEYGRVLEETARQGRVFRRESDLPFPKNVIRRALVSALLANWDQSKRKALEQGFISLETFLTQEEYEQASPFFDTLMEGESRILNWSQNIVDEDVRKKIRRLAIKIPEMPDPTLIMAEIRAKQQTRLEQIRILRDIACPSTDEPRVDRHND